MSERVAPVSEHERVWSMDVLRGVAVLGILAMNIVAFAQPFIVYMNPAAAVARDYAGPFTGLNAAEWWLAYLVCDTKMMSLFSMLFGAGLVMMDQRRESQGRRGLLGVYYRRLLWLFLIGMAHAYVIWFGDILVLYAVCGLLLYPMRRLRTRTLVIVGVLLFLVPIPVNAIMGGGMGYMRHEAREAERLTSEGKALSRDQAEAVKAWAEMREMMDPTAVQIREKVEQFRARDLRVLRANAEEAVGVQLMFDPIWGFWRATGLMLLGMALARAGAFSAQREPSYYTRLLVLGYGLGVPVVLAGGVLMVRHNFDIVWMFAVDGQFNYLGSAAVALGHVGAIMLACRAMTQGRLNAAAVGLLRRLGAVGRMPLTNYLAESILCTAIFYGWGLGLFGRFERWQLAFVVLLVWGLELAWSPWWLARFQFGPAEWLWRSLTYWRRQPMRRA